MFRNVTTQANGRLHEAFVPYAAWLQSKHWNLMAFGHTDAWTVEVATRDLKTRRLWTVASRSDALALVEYLEARLAVATPAAPVPLSDYLEECAAFGACVSPAWMTLARTFGPGCR